MAEVHPFLMCLIAYENGKDQSYYKNIKTIIRCTYWEMWWTEVLIV